MSLLPTRPLLQSITAWSRTSITGLVIIVAAAVLVYLWKPIGTLSTNREQYARSAARPRLRGVLPHGETTTLHLCHEECIIFYLNFNSRTSLITIKPSINLQKLLRGSTTTWTRIGAGRTTFEFVKGSEEAAGCDAVVRSIGSVTLIVRHNGGDRSVEYRFSLVATRSVWSSVPEKWITPETKVKGVDGESAIAALIESLVDQGAMLIDESEAWGMLPHSLIEDQTPPELQAATVAVPLLRQFSMSGTKADLRLKSNELCNLPFSNLTSISLTDFDVSYDDFWGILSRCSELRAFTLHQICDVPSVLWLQSESCKIYHLELPSLASLTLTSYVSLKRFFLVANMPKLNSLVLNLFEPVQECSVVNYAIDWSKLAGQGSFNFTGQISNMDIDYIRGQLQEEDWEPAICL